MAFVYGFWDRYEPRPPEDEIDTDLYELMLWVAEIAESLDPKDIEQVEWFARQQMK